ncbi:deoxyribonuclease IV [Caldalkalibacillus mannanilyticus]|uniref:deoxyribonuclease IV n=1 Tax=Caldalkalibacillus mannanilyticus TaxID=1418 RepID=UPI00046ACEAF|nr:deoxyribonuclease IV [Caldalkalibacillus mannanilyticus]
MKLGCHVSVAKGFLHASKQAKALGAVSFQVFTKNPRGLKPKKLDVKDAQLGLEFCQKEGIDLICHTPYITNLSTPKEDLLEATIRSIKEDLLIAEAFGAKGAVVHCGKHVGEGEEAGTKRMIETLNLILQDYEGSTKLLLENTAGQGSEIGLEIQTLVDIRLATDFPEKIGFCFDTCHSFAAGQWDEDTFPALVDQMEGSGYLDALYCIHFNDSKAPFGSRKDRHEKIGKGEIGAAGLKQFLLEERFAHLPIILETPAEDEQEYAEEILYLKELIAEGGK